MNKRDVRTSKFLSLVLRHKPQTIGVSLDEHGWINVDTLLLALTEHGRPLTHSELERIIRENDKQRFALSEDGQFIRASQGHSVEVDLALVNCEPPETLYHGTVEKFLPSILEIGLVKGNRHHVHLSPDLQTAIKVGQRRGRAIILRVDTAAMHLAGHLFYQSANGVWLSDHVPPHFLKLLEDQ